MLMDGCQVKTRSRSESASTAVEDRPSDRRSPAYPRQARNNRIATRSARRTPLPTPHEPLAAPRETVCLVTLHGQTVGLASVSPEGRDSGSMGRFYVDPAWQRTTVFERLLTCVHDHCAERGYARLSLDTSVVPGWVRRCLGRHGFRLLGQERVDGRDVLEFAVVGTAQAGSACL
jgi:hypothetical protein